SSSDITNNTSFDVDVWGGDSFVGLHYFKVNDSAFMITSGYGYSATPTETNSSEHNELMEEQYGRVFDSLGSGHVLRTVPLKASEEIIGVYLESEVNPKAAFIPDNAFS